MSQTPPLSDLLARWHQLRQQGQTLSLAELCADCPERLEELKQHLREVASMQEFLQLSQQGTDPSRPSLPMHDHATVPPARPLSQEGTDASRPSLPVHDDATVPPAGSTLVAPAASGPAGAVAGYEILGELGRGGMGVVYKARQLKLNRLVALKMILAGGHAGQAELARFRTEGEAVARLQHPNIVQIHEVGEKDGLPYFSLEFCEGGSLADRLDGTPWPARDAAQMVETLARAMHAAHNQNIVHRDLKPANVLLAPNPKSEARNPKQIRRTKKENPKQDSDAVSDIRNSDLELVSDFGFRISDFVPKVTDFGLAKRLKSEPGMSAPGDLTQSGAVMGTPAYMAPEQAMGQNKQIGPAADIYALGVILYELLTGRPPFQAETPLDTIMQVAMEEPVPPSRLNRKVPRDLETICLKCLQKEPKKRYPTAEAFAEDLRRYQAGEPIMARPAGVRERVIKWVRRRPMVAGLIAVVFVLTVGGVASFAWAFRQAVEARDDAIRALLEKEQQLARAERLLYLSHIAEAQNHLQKHDLVGCRLALDECRWDFRGPEYGYLADQLKRKARTLYGHVGPVKTLVLNSDGKRLFSGCADGTIKVWDLAGMALSKFLNHSNTQRHLYLG